MYEMYVVVLAPIASTIRLRSWVSEIGVYAEQDQMHNELFK